MIIKNRILKIEAIRICPIFITPISMNRKNTYNQCYSTFPVTYLIGKTILIIIDYVFKEWSISQYTYIPLIITILILYILNAKYQPFYDIRVNTFRNGIFGFLMFIGIFSFIPSFVSSKSIMMLIGSLISGVLGFFVGAFISVKFYQKCNEKIYFRYKIALNINDPDMVSSDDEDQELEGNDHNNNNYLVDKEESGTTSSSSYSSKESEENNENINEEEGEGEEEEEEEEGGEGEEEEDDDDEDDDNSNNRDESSTSGTGITDYGGDEELALFNSLYEIGE
ncbi:hypothetical protein LY90DRAFT_512372 [Neocallimastix californiae]|uniref:Uncharacterized protein n=1 Tax=Neocallimastix californiae TaxID=1754190 RepID=A0A1Y2BBG2_9FUNG|nr:hypothetical protein LY90DRAFT_512372 [Neocallimastix californiae]|eukprot:ORY31890.1 hypothetical protein LY90DRAFT_512372 [Neocallimastix californiae]